MEVSYLNDENLNDIYMNTWIKAINYTCLETPDFTIYTYFRYLLQTECKAMSRVKLFPRNGYEK